jgi:tetratricopeptide (TPR) repeat protein
VGVLALEVANVRRSPETWRRAAANLAPYLIAAALYAAIRSAANLPDRIPPYFSISERLIFALQALGTYLLMLIDPLRPRLQIGITGVVEWSKVALGMATTALIALLGWRAFRDEWEPLPTAALVTGLAALLPVLHIVPITVNVLAADRFLYLFAAGAAVAVGSWARHLTPAHLRVAAACGLIAIPTFGVSAHLRSRDWRDELRLFERSIERTHPENALPRTLLGVALLRRNRTEEALAELERSWDQQRAFWRSHTWAGEDAFVPANIAIARAELGRHEEAIEAMREVIRLGPWVPLSRYNLALMFAQTFQFEKAEQQLRIALLLYPGYERARRMLVELGPVRDAWRALPEERSDEPSSLSASRAMLYARMGRLHDAVRHWERVALSEDASPDELLRAATFLVARADLQIAERAFERLRTALPESPKLPMIERALVGRRAAYVF